MGASDDHSLDPLIAREPYVAKQIQQLRSGFQKEDLEDVDWALIYDALKKIVLRLRHTKFASLDERETWLGWVLGLLPATMHGLQEQAKRQALYLEAELLMVDAKVILALHGKIPWKKVLEEVTTARRLFNRLTFTAEDAREIFLRVLDWKVRNVESIQAEHSAAHREFSAFLTKTFEKVVFAPTLPTENPAEGRLDPLDEKVSLFAIIEVMKAKNEEHRKQLEIQGRQMRGMWHSFAAFKAVVLGNDRKKIFIILDRVQGQSNSGRELWFEKWKLFHKTRLDVFRVLGSTDAEPVEAGLEDLKARFSYWQLHVLELEGRFEWAEGHPSQRKIALRLNEAKGKAQRLRVSISEAERVLARSKEGK